MTLVQTCLCRKEVQIEMGKGDGSGEGKGEGHGEGQGRGKGRDAMDALAAGGAAGCCFLIFMFVIGLPMLLSGIAIVCIWTSG